MKGLLILDIQNDFTSSNARFPVDPNQANEIINNINMLTANSQSMGFIPIYIGNEFSKNDFRNFFRNFAAIKDSEGCKIDKRLNVVNENYFPKNRSSAFVNKSLKQFLDSKKVNELYITGLYAEACVWATVKDAVKQDFGVAVLSDCIASGTNKKRNSTIEKYKKMGITISSAESMITN